MNTRIGRTLVTTLLVAITVSPAAFAGANSQAQRQATDQISRQRLIQGDGENIRQPDAPATNLSLLPASYETRPADEAAMRAAAGNAKSQQLPKSSVVLVRTNSGFKWGDAGIGAAAAAGAILLLLGGLLLIRPERRQSLTAPPQFGTSDH